MDKQLSTKYVHKRTAKFKFPDFIFSGGPLYQGQIEDYKGKCHVMCPWHSYMFDLKTGANDLGLQVLE
jgi:hypothetical protein